MPDMEKVIELIEFAINVTDCRSETVTIPMTAGKNALALLKEQEAKTGHWVSVNDGDVVAIDNDGFPERACFCSECKKYLVASDEYAVYGRFCPYCGSKMEGREVNDF